MNNIIETVRQSLLQEASGSPNLLADLAGLEKYIAESYSSRSFIELLQNADDAGSTKMLIKRLNEHIIVANDGRKFTALDFESLCRSAASKKERKTSIGFRGIGFKSVVGFAKQIHIISGNLKTTFSRELTSSIIPEASAVPLIRIPHPIDPKILSQLSSEAEDVLNKGYNTIFVFSDLIANFVENEFESLEPSSLLFLKNVNKISFESHSKITYSAKRAKIDNDSSSVELSTNSLKQNWIVFTHQSVSIAIQKEEKKYANLPPKEAVVHAFLPTSEETGFGFKINGNISTDPSRLRVIWDDNTIDSIRKVSALYISLLKKCFDHTNVISTENLIESLLPQFDPRMIKLQKQSFKKQFMELITELAREQFLDFYRRPNWLNSNDSSKLANNSKINIPPRDIGETEGVDNLLKFFGVQEVTLGMLSSELKSDHLTTQGAAEIVSHITKQSSTKQISPDIVDKDWKIWTVNNKNVSLSEVVKRKCELDTDFIDIVTEKVGLSSELPRLLNAVTDPKVAKIIVPPKEIKPFKAVEVKEENETKAIPSKNISLVKWRSAEQQVLEILNSEEWTAKDVSRQNIGYDIEATNPQGETICVEVKSLKYEGQDFSLTSNEEATAREKGSKYVLALVIQKQDELHVMFIEDPLSIIKLERQCRQWVWICSSYDFIPKIYEFKT
jgi:hypothetical protein